MCNAIATYTMIKLILLLKSFAFWHNYRIFA